MRSFSDDQTARIVSRARALGEPTRVRILSVLARGEYAVGRLAAVLAIEQSTLSKHLQVLFNAGLVHRRREANTVIYEINTPELIGLCHFLGRRALHRAEVSEGRMESSRDPRRIHTWKGTA
jgi:DNA-binding transcriptional ArsR family regulator